MKRNKILFFTIMLTFQFSSYAEVNTLFKEGINALSGHIQLKPECDTSALSLSKRFSKNGADCTNFIKSDGSLGELGTVIRNHLTALGTNAVFFHDDFTGFNKACPLWNSLSSEAKMQFIVWLMAAISYTESTCNPSAVNAMATHGIAIGLLQLNKRRKDREWRGGETGKSCSARNISASEDNLKCGLEILNEQLKGKDGLYKGSGDLYGPQSNSYWEHLRKKNGGKIIKLVRDFPLCGNKKGPF